jgi:c-di-GMP-binding flagellar brake protein YcgR
MSSLADMNLKMGQPVQLQLARMSTARLYTQLIGFLSPRAVLVTTPKIPSSSGAFAIVDGDQFVCRAFAGRSAFAFETEVLKAAHLPFPHLHLRYPQSVEAVVVRRASRVPMERAVSLINGAAEGEAGTGPASLLDLSLTGAGLCSVAGFAAQSDAVELLIPGVEEQQPELRLKAIVRKVRGAEYGAEQTADAKPQAHYGLEFIDLTPEHTRSIQNLIQQQLLSEV